LSSAGIKILYISGWTRSGSTILDRILGHIEGYFSLGEFRYVWDRGLVDNRLCGSGVPFRNDEIWTQVFDKAFGGMDPSLGTRMTGIRDRMIPKRALGWMLLPGGFIRPRGYSEFMENLRKTYEAISEVTGATVIVDSSKSPPYGHLLASLPGFDVRTVHLVRDPRAVSQSWLKSKTIKDGIEGEAMSVLHPANNAFHWNYWNFASEILVRGYKRPYIFLRYEDLMENPRVAVDSLTAFMGTPGVRAPFVTDNSVELGADHTVSGNPDRMKKGIIELKADNRWMNQLPASARRWTEFICWRGMRRYGYK